MNTYESPQARLRREMGWRPVSSGPRVSDWIKLGCGDLVCRLDDPRHVGEVVRINNGAFVLVRWRDTRWLEEALLRDLSRSGLKED